MEDRDRVRHSFLITHRIFVHLTLGEWGRSRKSTGCWQRKKYHQASVSQGAPHVEAGLIKRIWCVVLMMAMALAAPAQDTSAIKEILVNGNQNISRDAIVATMRTKVGQPYLQSTLDLDRKSIEDMGFFQAVDIQAKPLEVGIWQIIVTVAEFPVIKEIRVVGNSVIKTEQILEALTLKAGQVFNLKSVQPSSNAIRKLYSDRGLFVQFDEFGLMQEAPNTLNIVLLELTVNSVSVQGNTRTKDSVFRHLIKTREGDPYDVRKWGRDMQRIYNTGWFERDSVKSVERESDQINKIDLIANVKEAPTGLFNIGLQFDPRSNFAGLLKLSDSNFRGTGQNVGINYLQSAVGSGASLDVEYGNPWIDARDTSMQVALYSRLVFRFAGSGFGGGGSPTDDNRYTERRTGFSLGFARPVREDVSGSLSARIERIETADLNTGSTNAFIMQDGEVAVLSFGLTRNKRDVDIEPASGTWTRILVEPGYSNITKVGGASTGAELGSSTFFRTNLEYRAYFSKGPPRGRELDASRRVLAVRARLGTISGKVPFFEQFFAGGSDTVRGYAEDRFWGRQTLLTSVEYRVPIQKAFNAIAFLDYGGAWGGFGSVNTYTQSNAFKMHVGYGVGFSFRTPLGPIRLDFGFNENGGSRTHFLIGTTF